MSQLKSLQELCNKALKESERQNIERLSEIKKLTKSLLMQYYEINDAQSYAKVIQTALHYIQQIKNNRPNILASVFDLEQTDMDVARYFLEEGGDGLIWNILQHHDLIGSKRAPKEIQPFMNRVAEQMELNSQKPLVEVQSLLKNLNESYERQDLQKLHLYAQLFTINIKQAFQRNEPHRVAELLRGIMPLCEKGLQLGQYELLVSLFHLDKEEIEDLHACYQNRAKALIHWLLVDDLELEKYAKEMPNEHHDVQAFKQSVLAGIGTVTPLKTPMQLAKEVRTAIATQDENTLVRIDVEGWCNEVQSYLDNDVAKYANIIDTLYQQIQLAYDNSDLATIAKFLDIGREDLDELIVLLQRKDINAIRYFLIQNEQIEEIAFDHATHQDGSDATRAIEFRKALYEYFAAPYELTANLAQINELVDAALQNPTTEQFSYVDIKISQALQNAFQQNNVDAYLAFCHKAVEVYSMLMENDISTLMLSLKLPKAKREAFLYYLQAGKTNECVAILIDDGMNFHKGFKYASHQHLLDFKERAFEKLGIDKIPGLDIKTNNESEAHHAHPNFIQYWSSQIASLGASFNAEKTLVFREQVKLKLQYYFKENDVQGYSETVNLLRKYRDKCIKHQNLAGLSLVLAIDHDDVNTTLNLMNSENHRYVEWRTIQQHELDEVCERGEVKYAEIGPFLNKVYQNLHINPKKCFRERSAIFEDLKSSIDKDREDDLQYYTFELEGLLKQAIYSNDPISAARTVDAIVTLAQYAYESNCFDVAYNILKLAEVDIETINQCFAENKIDLLKFAYINDINLEKTFRHYGHHRAKGELKSNILDNLSTHNQQLFPSINKLEKLITDALQDQNESALRTLSFECDMMVRHAFLQNNQALFAEMNRLYARLVQKGVELRRNDLVIRHFDIDPDYVELIQLILNQPGLSFDQAAFDKLELFTILQSQELEFLGALYDIKNDDIQAFKRQAHATLLHEPDGLLLCEPRWIAEHGQALINQPQVARLEKQLWNAHVDAHIEFAYENGNHLHFADIVFIMNDLAHRSFQAGNLSLLLDTVDFKPKERDALFHHLQHQNTVGSAHVLTEVLLRNHADRFRDKFGYHFYPDFRIKIYERLNIPPAEMSFMSNDKIHPGIKPLIGDEKGFENLSWLRNKGPNIDINDPFTQNVIRFLAIHDLGDSAIDFLQILDTPNTIKAAELLKGFRLEHQLSHRLGLTGERSIEGVTIKVEGGYEADMVSQLYDIQNKFYANSAQLDAVLQDIYQQPVDGSTLAQDIKSDLSAISLRNNAQTVATAQIANRVVNIPVNLETVDQSEFTAHAVNCCFFDEFCLLADRSRTGADSVAGIRICKITKPENKDSISNELGNSITDQMPVKDEEYENYVTENLGLLDVGFIPMTPQTAGNCTWSSCAEMMHLSTVYAKLFQYGLKTGLTEQQAMTKAIEGATTIHEALIAENLTNLVQQYLTFQQTSSLKLEPKTLAMVYLRCEHHPMQQHIATMIKDANILQPQDLTDAYEHLLNDAKDLIPENIRQNLESSVLTQFAKGLLDLFLKYDLAGAAAYYENIPKSSQSTNAPKNRAQSVIFRRPTISSRETLEDITEDDKKSEKTLKRTGPR